MVVMCSPKLLRYGQVVQVSRVSAGKLLGIARGVIVGESTYDEWLKSSEEAGCIVRPDEARRAQLYNKFYVVEVD